MKYLLILFFFTWLVGFITFCLLCWNTKLAKGHKLELIACALLWPRYLIIEIWP